MASFAETKRFMLTPRSAASNASFDWLCAIGAAVLGYYQPIAQGGYA